MMRKKTSMPSRTNVLRTASPWLAGSCSRPRLPWMLQGAGWGGREREVGQGWQFEGTRVQACASTSRQAGQPGARHNGRPGVWLSKHAISRSHYQAELPALTCQWASSRARSPGCRGW